ncbi:MAG: glycosyltransferase family 4 protein [Candidatus Omnitrophota bacterium]
MKVLFIVPYPTEGASNRVRVEQFIAHLEKRGVVCAVRPFVSRPFFKILYKPHRYAEKIFWFIIGTINRMIDIVRALWCDIVVIHREAYPFGGPVFESILFRMGKPFVFDFDDAIFLPNTSEHNIPFERFKRPNKVAKIIRMSHQVIAGNEYLKEYAARFNRNVVVIPSSIDTEKYLPAKKNAGDDEIVIGWIGSNTTKVFLYDLEDTLKDLLGRYRNVRFEVVGAEFYSDTFDRITNRKWSLENEVASIQRFDIGIMPMPDNDWTRGKCGFKAILYMACGLPVVASPVGVNRDIIDDGVSGFLAEGPDEWKEKLAALIEDRALRDRMGASGRQKIIKGYSTGLTAPMFYDTLSKIVVTPNGKKDNVK